MKSFAAAAVLLVPLVLASCGGDDGSGPERREPGSITLNEADFELNDGDTLQIFASVFDQNDDVFAELPEGVEIVWSTDNAAVLGVLPDGRVIGVSPGVTTVRADIGEGIEAAATVEVLAVPTEIVAITGHQQSGLPNTALEDSVVFRVLDRHGNGVSGVSVAFGVTSGGGSVSPTSSVSNAQGRVRVQWTLGPEFADQSIEATSAEIEPLAVQATMSPAVFAEVDVATSVAQGGTLPGAIRLNSEFYTVAIGGAHVVVSWDPAKLQLQGGSVTSGDFARSVRWFDNATGELHVVSTDPHLTAEDVAAADLVFDVVAGAGTSTTIGIDVQQLIGIDFSSAASASVASDVVVNIN